MTAPLGWNQSKIIARLFCASPTAGKVEMDPAEAATLDGRRLVSLAASHNLAEVLYATLSRLSYVEILAEPDRTRLRLEHLEALRRHQSRTEQLVRLHQALQGHGIPYVLLKEHAFDARLPAAACIRQNDFDILARPSDLCTAERLLVSLGYARVARPWAGEFRFKSEGRLSVDLHTSLGSHHDRRDEFLDEEAAFARIRPVEVASELVPVLHPEDGALFLVLHTALHHNFTPFKTVVNCWNYIASRDRELSACRPSAQARNVLWLTLRYMEEITGYSLEWTKALVPPSSLTRRFFRGLLPDAKNFFAEDVDPNLRRSCRTGLHLCLYPPTFREKLLCLARIARIRAAAWI
jgi:hypothetical protein